MGYCYTLSIGHSGASTVWSNFGNYVRGKRGNYRKDAEAELSAFNAALDLSKTELLFKTESDRTLFLLKFS
jgi:hypothetical protein